MQIGFSIIFRYHRGEFSLPVEWDDSNILSSYVCSLGVFYIKALDERAVRGICRLVGVRRFQSERIGRIMEAAFLSWGIVGKII